MCNIRYSTNRDIYGNVYGYIVDHDKKVYCDVRIQTLTFDFDTTISKRDLKQLKELLENNKYEVV